MSNVIELPVKKSGPSINRHASKQDYVTPSGFILSVERRFGPLTWDLACTQGNKRAPLGFTPEENSLAQDWSRLSGNLWLNPEFGNAGEWAKKCAETDLHCTSRILLLVPASVGANWFVRYVKPQAYVLALQGRLTFGGCDQPFPKDLILAVYGHGFRGFDTWSWREASR